MDNTDNNRSTIEILTEFAEFSKRNIFSKEMPYPTSAADPVMHYKKSFFMPDKADENCFLIGFHDPKSFNENELFFGVFFPLPLSKTSKINIRKKDILDKLNPFKHNIYKTDSDNFDSLTVITGNDNTLNGKLLSNSHIQQLIIDSLNISELINIGLNEFDLDFVPAFENRSNFGIFTKQKWILDSTIIENLFTKTEQLRKLITERLNIE
jgi:hypothetical protein